MKGLSTMKLFLLFPLLLATIEYASSSSPSVIIIGAGMSGISAAKRLEDAGIKDFVILEATNRIGGRIKKTEFAGYTVEMGANWLHGVGGRMRNPLYEMSKQIHLKKFYSDFSNISSNTYKQEGGLYKKDEVDAAINKVDKTIEDGVKYSNILNSEKDGNDNNDMSILAFERLYKREPRTKLERAVDFFNFDAEQGQAPRVTSLKHVLPFPEGHYYGENSYFVADSRGFESLVHLIAKQFLSYKNGVVNDPRVKFNQMAVSRCEKTSLGAFGVERMTILKITLFAGPSRSSLAHAPRRTPKRDLACPCIIVTKSSKTFCFDRTPKQVLACPCTNLHARAAFRSTVHTDARFILRL